MTSLTSNIRAFLYECGAAIHRWAYISLFMVKVIIGIIRPQRLRFPTIAIEAEEIEFELTKKERSRWYSLYKMDEKLECDFDYAARSFQAYFFRLLGRLGIKYSNILHLAHGRQFFGKGRGVHVGDVIRMSFRLADISLTERGRGILTLEIVGINQHNKLVYKSEDKIYVKNIHKKDQEKILFMPGFNQRSVSKYDHIREIEPQLKARGKRVTTYLDENLGMSFGAASGDLNPIHTLKFMSRLFGYKKPFVQGLYTANFILVSLMEGIEGKVQSFNVIFCKPMLVDQYVSLYYDETGFEVLDQKGNLIVVGEWQAFTPESEVIGFSETASVSDPFSDKI
jgi:acyl dehydratase